MILLTGGTGQVGRSILAQVQAHHGPFFAPSRSELDLSDPQSLQRVLESRDWTAIINAGAYTAVDQAESEPLLADAINANAPATMAQFCQERAIPLIHFSTDYVFAGDASVPYKEEAHTAPLGVYGASKLAGEQAIVTSHARAVILRTAWVVSPYGKNFIKTMLRLAQDREEIRVVADQYGCPTGAADLASVVLSVLPRLLTDKNAPTGIYHCSNQGETTWAGLARAVMDESAGLGGARARIIDITTADYPTPAKRPHYSRLSCDRLQKDWDITLRAWQPMVAEIVAALLQEKETAE
jgi:dTDP-4-dehydrorhamnose reductase